ncbi:hypothetical protein GCM10025770_11670 [Viridibacterium curvum]|uniref:Pectate lyase superfamily protein domain-containing protein n=2 Tax=Viridibacterium curvum TaxID=1101404 RepID=A0ABP9QH62_9RHOO
MPADRRTVWNPGLNAVGGIPARSTIYQTLSPSGNDDTAAIQAALNTCPAGQVVRLAAGTFKISGMGLELPRSNITLRGAGSSVTRLVQADNASYPVIVVGTRWVKHTESRPLTANGAKGSYSITVSSAAGLKIGEIITLNQVSDDTRSDTVAPVRKVYWGKNTLSPTDDTRRWFCELNRPIGQSLEITAINGNQITFNTPLHIDFETALSAHICRFSTQDPDSKGWSAPWASQVDATRYTGIEDLAVVNGGGGDGGGNIHFWACAYCWVKNVESSGSIGHSCNLENSFRCEVRDSYFHSTRDPNPGGAGYGIGLNVYSSDCLFENNIVWGFNKLTIGRASGGGNVFGYNYLQDGYGAGYVQIPEVGSGANHYAGAHMELFEGNECFNADSESYWGNAIYGTYYRNHFTGLRISASPLTLVDAFGRRIVGVDAHAWWFSFVGNVLGFPAMPLLSGTDPHGDTYNQTGFIYQTDSNWYSNYNVMVSKVPVWNIGHDGDNTSAPDPLALARTYRHGNYDYFTQTTVWDGGTSNHSLPASLYLSAKPAFFGSNPWPRISPETPSTPLLGELPAKARFRAIKGLALTQQ